MNIHPKNKLPSLYQSCLMGPDSLYCGKWRKISKSCPWSDNAQYQTCPSYSHILFLFELACKYTHTHTHTYTHARARAHARTHAHTHTHKYRHTETLTSTL